MMKKLWIAVLFGLFFFLAGCDDKKSVTENNSYNAFFVPPDPKKGKIYVGTVKGLSSCKYIVGNYYTKRRNYIKGDWDYICCLRVEGNECLEEHRYEN